MNLLGLGVLALVTLAATAYAQYRIPALTTTITQAWITRVALILTGIAFGFVVATVYAGPGLRSPAFVLVFVSAFGLVHVPAAAILFLKQRQRAER